MKKIMDNFNHKEKRIITIYTYFIKRGYNKEQVDVVLTKLNDEEINLLKLRHGEDYKNSISVNELPKNKEKSFYHLLSRMKKMMDNPNFKRKERKVVIKEAEINELTKEDYEKVLEMVNDDSFNRITEVLTPEETIIVGLKKGYNNGRCFSTKAIAEFLEISEQEIDDIMEKCLLIDQVELDETTRENTITRKDKGISLKLADQNT